MMQTLHEDISCLIKEKDIATSLKIALDSKQSFIFRAGAGSGKTYSLIQSLRHLMAYHGHSALSNNQKFVCITYTNAAANEVRDRIGGGAELCRISTIHEFMWETIKSQQNALIELHNIKIGNEIDRLNLKLEEDGLLVWIYSGNDDGESFQKFTLDDKNYTILKKNKSAQDITNAFASELNAMGYILKGNIGKFKSSFKLVRKIEKLKLAKEQLNNGEVKEIKYTPEINLDLLDKMCFSHDTLLEYTYELFSRYPALRKIFIASHPYVLVDEYQDTHKYVIQSLKLVQDYARYIDLDFTVGYFGDEVQTIYGDGVGQQIYKLHSNLIEINKNINRRSFNEVIDVINKIRMSDPQRSIYSDAYGGHVSAYKITNSSSLSLESIINKFSQEVINDSPVDFLVLKNASLSQLSGFGDIYEQLSKFFHFEEAAQKIISTDQRRLHWCVRELAKLIYPVRVLHEKGESSSLHSILPLNINRVTIKESINYIAALRKLASVESKNLSEHIVNLNEFSNLHPNSIISELITQSIPAKLNGLTKESLQEFLFNYLPDDGSKSEEERYSQIKSIMDINFQQYINWYDYISSSITTSIRYHTCHGSKGLEYKNVVVVIENKFNKNDKYFEQYFLSPDDNIEQKNLLYVSCSRAIKNLYILFLDDISQYQNEAARIFGDIKPYNMIN
ncbi:TPA: UvrD-helicase domain-containing protein [Aeromonas veronii]